MKGEKIVKISCDIIKDLIPLYIDDLCSEDSTTLINDHIKECRDCESTLKALQLDIKLEKKQVEDSEKLSVRLFKKVVDKILILICATLIAGVFIGIFGESINKGRQSRSSAKKFFQKIEEGKYEQAFDYLYYWDEASDIESTMTYEHAREIWVKRVADLKKQDIYIKSFESLKVGLDDTYPTGSVELVVIEKGEEKRYKADLWFAKDNSGKWKIGNIYEGNNQTMLEKAISGYIVRTE